jgi:hypothetical protein
MTPERLTKVLDHIEDAIMVATPCGEALRRALAQARLEALREHDRRQRAHESEPKRREYCMCENCTVGLPPCLGKPEFQRAHEAGRK